MSGTQLAAGLVLAGFGAAIIIAVYLVETGSDEDGGGGCLSLFVFLIGLAAMGSGVKLLTGSGLFS